MSSTAPTTAGHRPVLWVLLVLAVVANGTCSLLALPVAGSVFGLLALVSGGLLVRDHYRRRARTAAGR
ncbi:hypothetical protein SAMN05216207_1014104 [Pseudonocardia ammonioxydans]|uniref:Uncharacterized protein n=1 Tax=Pseudonocardia ammonioxydans TaxID=260086 RepID=A0A1I4Z5S9_PSUAM|nr:hypothetical protein [Pseudonocardia ammonioxydans]SFN45373.1 hypothetical protein SAMN05216207_1014104 [Pseudonocardia ammonioxydans]